MALLGLFNRKSFAKSFLRSRVHLGTRVSNQVWNNRWSYLVLMRWNATEDTALFWLEVHFLDGVGFVLSVRVHWFVADLSIHHVSETLIQVLLAEVDILDCSAVGDWGWLTTRSCCYGCNGLASQYCVKTWLLLLKMTVARRFSITAVVVATYISRFDYVLPAAVLVA